MLRQACAYISVAVQSFSVYSLNLVTFLCRCLRGR